MELDYCHRKLNLIKTTMKIDENDVKITSKEILRNKGMLKKLKIDSRHTLKCKNLATVQK